MRADERLRPYVPGFVVDWLRTTPAARHRRVEGTLAFVDISGFTRLTERLAGRGKVGAEEMTGILDRTFAELLAVAYGHGAWLVKWGGDAVLLLFQGDDHAARAATAALGMRRTMDDVGRLTTASGRVRLRVSMGLHSGSFDFFLVGSTHRELVITGPGPSTTAALEAAASAGQVAISPQTAALLPASCVRPRPDGTLLVARSPGCAPQSPVRTHAGPEVDLSACLPAVTRDYLLSGSDDAEHRLVAVAFVEFSGVDALLAEQGPGAVTAAVDAVISTCQESAARNGVTFWETDISKDGGKVMLVAGVPTSSGSEEDAMLAVARDVVERDLVLGVRVGVNSGRVFFGQFGPAYRRTMSVKGDAVNLAARLMGKAGRGEVLAAVQVVARARTPYAAEALPPFTVKGKKVLVHACRVEAPRAAALPATDASALFFGRETELARLQAEWRLASAGRLRICELVGEPGVGKSRLVAQLVSQVDGRVLEMRADRYTATTAYAPFRTLLRGLLDVGLEAPGDVAGAALLATLAPTAPDLLPYAPLVAAVLDAEVPATPESAAVDERFRAQRQEEVVVDLLLRLLPGPTALVLDDAHALDASSVQLLRRLGQRATDAPWLVLVLRREETDARPLDGVDGVVRTVLAPLDSSASLELVHALTEASPLPPHEVAVLMRRADGNPLFLNELAAAAAAGSRVDELPDSVEHVVAARIDALEPADRTLLRAAAVIGMDVRPATLQALAERAGIDVPPGSLRRLEPFLAPVGSALRFRHALLQETAYEGLPYSRRKLLHGHVGDALAAITGPEADAVLSLHYLRADRFSDAWATAARAGDRAWKRSAPAEAAELYERALLAARHLHESQGTAAVRESLGDARLRLGQFALAQASYTQARRETTDPLTAARLCHRIASSADRSGSYPTALRWLTAADKLLADRAVTPDVALLRARIDVLRGTIRHWQGRHVEAVRLCSSAVQAAEAVGAVDVLAEALVCLDVSRLALGQGDGSDARRALQVCRVAGDRPWHEARCLNELGIRAYFAGRWDEARTRYGECRAAMAVAGDAWAASVALGNEAEVLCDQGHLVEAERLTAEALRAWRASGASSFIAFGQRQLARLAARRGRAAEALRLLEDARSRYAADGEVPEVLETDSRRCEVLLLAGDPQAALALADQTLEAVALQPGLAPQVPLLQRARGLALALSGQFEDAVDALELSRRAAVEREATHEIALTLHALQSVRRAGGLAVDDDEAAESSRLLDSLGIIDVAEPHLEPAAAPSPAG